jgi:protein-L-isoaspartate(D-aspartate) O-methyltransferase
MADFAAARRNMVDSQVRTSDVTDPALIAAMLAIPRERFLPAAKASLAYIDYDVPVLDAAHDRPARRLLKPMVLAKLIQAASPAASDHALDVGCATGYSAALLSRLVADVIALEEDAGLARAARERLSEAGCANVEVVEGPLVAGWQPGAPYDVILLEGAVEILPRALCDQLREGGRLVCIRGSGPAAKAMLYRMDMGEISGRPIFDAAASLLPGFAETPGFVF